MFTTETQTFSIRQPGRFLLYFLISGISGFAWSLIWVCLIAVEPTRTGHVLILDMAIGVMTGVLVGSLMYPLYRRKDTVWTLLTAPLALWLGVTWFFSLHFLLDRSSVNSSLPSAVIFAGLMGLIVVITPPWTLLNLLALGNGLLMRSVIGKSADTET